MRNHIAFKFLAIVLCAAMLALALGSGATILVLADNSLFDRDIEQMRQERLEDACWDLSYYLVGKYALENLSNCPEDILYQTGSWDAVNSWYYSTYAVLFEDGEWFYLLQDSDGNTLAGSHRGPVGLTEFEATLTWEYPMQVGILYQDSATIPESANTTAVTESAADASPSTATMPPYDFVHTTYDENGTEVTYFLQNIRSPEYTVTLYLTEDAFPIYSAADWQLLEFAQIHRYHLIGIMALCLLLFAVLVSYLCCAAGRKPGSQEVSAQGLNRIPIDLYAAGVLAGILFFFMLLRDALWGLDYSRNGDSFLPLVLLIALVVYAGSLLAVGLVYAFAAQVKMPQGYWLRHSAVYWCLRTFWNAVCWCWRKFLALCRWLKVKLPLAYHAIKRLVIRLAKGLGRLCVRLWKLLLLCLKKLWQGVMLCGSTLVRFVKWVGQTLHRVFCLLPLTWQWLLTGFLLMGTVFLSCFTRHPGWILASAILFVSVILYGSHAFGILMENTKRMGKGDLDTKVDDKLLLGSFREFAGDLNALADVAVVAAQKQMKSERMKAELVTNVSHDIKTPLTSIINYVDLLQKSESQEEAEQYLEVLSRQSLRLKKLIEDLMEMSKASTGNLSVELSDVDATEAINQALGEFADKLAMSQLTPIFHPPQDPIRMRCDGRLTWRVLSNLLSNAVKYALPGTRLYIDLVELEGQVLISLKNISREQLNVHSEELMERFVRGDASRNTEGSGLGLNIAKSLMELQHGQLQLLVDSDLFKATLIFPKA